MNFPALPASMNGAGPRCPDHPIQARRRELADASADMWRYWCEGDLCIWTGDGPPPAYGACPGCMSDNRRGELNGDRTHITCVDCGHVERLGVPNTAPARAPTALDSDPELVIVRASDVAPEPVRWLLPGRVPIGMLTLLAGDPGLGKSTLTCLLGAQVSRGEHGPAGDVLMANAEDAPGATIVPRLIAANADLERVGFVRLRRDGIDEGLTLPDDLPALDARLRQRPCRLLIIDPLGAHLPSSVNSFQDASVRRALAPLARLADEHRCAVLIVAHLNKSVAKDAIYRVGGSIGVPAAVRSMILFGRDPDDPAGDEGAQRVAAHAKCNVAALAPTLVYRIEPFHLAAVDVESSRLVLLGESDAKPGDVLDSTEGHEQLDDAAEWLAEHLAIERQPSRETKAAARGQGIAERTLQRARLRLNVTVESEGRRTYWRLPDHPCQAPAAHVRADELARIETPMVTGNQPSDSATRAIPRNAAQVGERHATADEEAWLAGWQREGDSAP